MKFEIFHAHDRDWNQSIRFSGEITERDMEDLKLKHDELKKLARSNKAASDILVVLEMLYRKCEGQT